MNGKRADGKARDEDETRLDPEAEVLVGGRRRVGGGRASADAGAGADEGRNRGPAGMSVLRRGILLVGDRKRWSAMCKS